MTQGSWNASDDCVVETVPSVRHVDAVRASRAPWRKPVPDRLRGEAGIEQVRNHFHEDQHEQGRGERQDSSAPGGRAAYDTCGSEQQTWQTERRREEESQDRQDGRHVGKRRRTSAAEARRVRTGIDVDGRGVTRLPEDSRERACSDGEGDRAQDEQKTAMREAVDPRLTTVVLACTWHGSTVEDGRLERSRGNALSDSRSRRTAVCVGSRRAWLTRVQPRRRAGPPRIGVRELGMTPRSAVKRRR